MPPAYILAGGKSSRFGSDKALAEIDGGPLIERIANLLRPVSEPITVVAETPGKYNHLGLTTIADRLPQRGPLGGLHAALSDRLEHFGPGYISLTSCDLAGLKPEWLETLVNHVEPFGCDQANAIAFRGEKWQPFPAIYHTDRLPAIEELIDSGRASFQQLLSDPRANTVALPLPSDWPDVVQVNTREDLERLRTRND